MATPYYILWSHIDGCVIRSFKRLCYVDSKNTAYPLLWKYIDENHIDENHIDENHIDGCVIRSAFLCHTDCFEGCILAARL